jgi:hypothetical protein
VMPKGQKDVHLGVDLLLCLELPYFDSCCCVN